MRPCSFSLNELCNNDRQARIRFDLSTAAGVDIHSAVTTVADLEAGKTTVNANNGCTAVFDEFTVFERPTFIDYLRSGWQVGMTVAIDYTQSNGNPSDRNSLHFLGPNNQYESALINVGSVIEPYDFDKNFPVFGFGGMPRHMGINAVSHCFAVNGNAAGPNILLNS